MIYFAFGIALILAVALTLANRRHKRELAEWQDRRDALKESQAKLEKIHVREIRRLLDALPDPFFSIDHQRKIVRHNTPAANIFKGRDLDHRSVPQIFLDTPLLDLINEALSTRQATSRTLRLSANSPFSAAHQGSPSHWAVELKPVSIQTDRVEIQLLMRDITVSVVADQVRQDFVANASHELRTPLAIVSGYLENLIEDDGLDNKPLAQKMLHTMDRHVERINRLVEDMLVISRLESEESVPLKMEEFNLADCVQDVLERLESVIANQHATTTVAIPDIKITGDVLYWTQLLFNLVENALKQNAASPVRVQVSASQNTDGVTTITVQDNGIGIPANDLPFIFKRFYRVEKHHSQNQIKGTGLGLSIVKRAVEAHGGTITATSTPGVETAFTITLPNPQP